MDPTAEYPTIDPTAFDLVVSGTGLPAAIIAAAAAAAGKSVLHVDPQPTYGSHFSSLPPSSFLSFLNLPEEATTSHLLAPEQFRRKNGSGFLLDLAGPRLLYCSDPMVDLLLRSGASHHLEFKSIDGSLIYNEELGGFSPVLDSREKIFKDRSLGPMERNRMMRFLKTAQAHITGDDEESRVSQEDLEIPFVEFLEKQKLSPRIRKIFLYAIALADYDQDGREACKKVITTKEGIDKIALYIKSIGRFPNAVGAFIYPIYGHGELPQAFCRCAAVKGALYVLRMPVADLLLDEEKQYKGVKLASGQEIYSQQLAVEPPFTVPSSVSPPSEVFNISSTSEKVARGVCITNCSIHQDLSNILMIFPPRCKDYALPCLLLLQFEQLLSVPTLCSCSFLLLHLMCIYITFCVVTQIWYAVALFPEQLTTLRGLQLSCNVSVCPPGMFVVYFSTPCDDATLGKEFIRAALNAVFTDPNLNDADGSTTENEDPKEFKPKLLWSAVYAQELTQASFGTFYSCPMPDAKIDYGDLLESTMKLFSRIYPQEEFLPGTPASEIAEDDSSLSE